MKHQIRFTSAEAKHELGESTRGDIHPLVRGGGRGISPEKFLYFRTSVETILMHFVTIFALEALLIFIGFIIMIEAMSWSKTMKPD